MTTGLTYYITNKKELEQLLTEDKVIIIQAIYKQRQWWEFWKIGQIDGWLVIARK